ncbi:MAG: Putative oxidoreductase, partial [uncultured Pseudonocardia sp.]
GRRPRSPRVHRRPRGRGRAGRVGRGRLGRPARAGRRAGRLRGVPPRQGVRRRPHPPRDRRAGQAGAGRLGARPRHQPGPARRGVRPGAGAALARRVAARPRRRRAPHRAGRPHPRRRARGRRGAGRGGQGRRRRPGRRPRHRRGLRRRHHDRLPAPGRRGRRPVHPRPGAGPRVAPGHGVRRGRARLRPLRPLRRPVDLLAPGAARRGRRGAGRVRLGVPAVRRRGQRRCRHAGHGEAAREDPPARPHRALRRRPARGLAARRPGARGAVGAAAHGRGRVGRGRPELGAGRGRGRLRQPAQRRGHRLRPGDRPARGRPAGRRARPRPRLAGHPAHALRPGVLHRAPPRRSARRAPPAAAGGTGRHALARVDDRRAAGDGQHGHRRRPRPHRPRLARGRPGEPAAGRAAAVPGRRPAQRL